MSNARRFIINFISDITATRTGQWLFARLAHPLDLLVGKITGGRKLFSVMLTGLPVAVLTTAGAKSGLPRHTPVLLTMDGDTPILISTNWGQNKLPGWHYNLSANPRAKLEINGDKRTYLARKTGGAEREKYWVLAVRQYPGYETYKSRIEGREIGVWVLEPVENPPQNTQHTQRTRREL